MSLQPPPGYTCTITCEKKLGANTKSVASKPPLKNPSIASKPPPKKQSPASKHPPKTPLPSKPGSPSKFVNLVDNDSLEIEFVEFLNNIKITEFPNTGNTFLSKISLKFTEDTLTKKSFYWEKKDTGQKLKKITLSHVINDTMIPMCIIKRCTITHKIRDSNSKLVNMDFYEILSKQCEPDLFLDFDNLDLYSDRIKNHIIDNKINSALKAKLVETETENLRKNPKGGYVFASINEIQKLDLKPYTLKEFMIEEKPINSDFINFRVYNKFNLTEDLLKSNKIKYMMENKFFNTISFDAAEGISYIVRCGTKMDTKPWDELYTHFLDHNLLNLDQFRDQPGGSPTKITILGRTRNNVTKGRCQYAKYQGELCKISELKKIERKLAREKKRVSS